MPVTDSFLATCRAIVASSPELSAFRTAMAGITSTSRSARTAAWVGAYDNSSGPSPAYRLRKTVRDTVNAQADIAGTLSPLDRESAYRTLSAEVVPTIPRPPLLAIERDEMERLRLEDSMS